MPNVMLTDYCNQNCSYCFAKKMMDEGKGNISTGNFKRAIDFIVKSGEKKIGLIGGEPTLHPDFLELIDYVIGKVKITLLFTNGIIEKDISRKLGDIEEEGFSVLLNLNDKFSYSSRQLELIEYTLKCLGEKVSLGYNIHTTEFDLSFHLDMINKYGLNKELRVGLASPIAGKGVKDFFQPSDDTRVGKTLIKNAEMLEENDVLLTLDCGFYMCMFTSEQLGILTEKTAGFKSICNPILDIDLDLNVHRCFPLTGIAMKRLDDFTDLEGVRKDFLKRFEALKILGNEGRCLTCKYMKRKQCSGWCLGRIINANEGVLEKIQANERKQNR